MELGEIQLKLQYWYLAHKKSLRKWLKLILGVVDVLLIFYVILNLMVFLFGIGKINQVVAGMSQSRVKIEEYRERNKVAPPIVTGPKAIPETQDRYDLLAFVKNPNDNYSLLSFDYKFTWSGGETKPAQGFLLLAQEKLIFIEGVESTNGSAFPNLKLVLENIRYKKVRDSLPVKLSDFEIKNVQREFLTLSHPVTGQSILATRVKGEVVNNSIFSYWQLGLNAVLSQGEEPVGIKSIKLEKVLSFEVRPFEFVWDRQVGGITSIEVIPDINLLDNSNVIQN